MTLPREMKRSACLQILVLGNLIELKSFAFDFLVLLRRIHMCQGPEGDSIPWALNMKAELFVMVSTPNWQIGRYGLGQSHQPLTVSILRELVDSLRSVSLRSTGT